MFLPWYGIDTGFGERTTNSGWDYFLGGWLPAGPDRRDGRARRSSPRFSPDTKLPDLPVPWGQVHLVAGVVAAVLVVLRLLIASDDVRGVDVGVDLDRKFGLFLAVIAAIGVAVGRLPEVPGRRRRRRRGWWRHRLRSVLTAPDLTARPRRCRGLVASAVRVLEEALLVADPVGRVGVDPVEVVDVVAEGQREHDDQGEDRRRRSSPSTMPAIAMPRPLWRPASGRSGPWPRSRTPGPGWTRSSRATGSRAPSTRWRGRWCWWPGRPRARRACRR